MTISKTAMGAFEALKNGADIETVTNQLQDERGNQEVVEQEELVEEAVEPQESTELEDAIQSDSQDVIEEEDVLEEQEDAELPESSDVEEIKVNGRKVSIDYNDREKTKKAYRMAGLARKKQVEADQFKNELAELKPKYEESVQFERTIEDAFATGGIEGLVSLVAGGEEEFKKWEDARYERRRAKEEASPVELERMEAQERAERTAKELQRLKDERERESEERAKRSEETSQRELQNLMNPSFNKWRFSGKLGDSALEADVDQMVWTKATSALSQIPEDTVLTQKIVDREFRKAANALRKLTEREANAKVSNTMKSKRKEAARKVAVAAARGPESQSKDTEMREQIKQGNLRGALNAFLGK